MRGIEAGAMPIICFLRKMVFKEWKRNFSYFCNRNGSHFPFGKRLKGNWVKIPDSPAAVSSFNVLYNTQATGKELRVKN
jgi:hypothetical protein